MEEISGQGKPGSRAASSVTVAGGDNRAKSTALWQNRSNVLP
ncbi:hypothetical protein [Pantoea graminicola]|nr:hypothetical protein [Pantoea sp. ARC607]